MERGQAQTEVEGRAETELERYDRNLTELMGELRVALPGVRSSPGPVALSGGPGLAGPGLGPHVPGARLCRARPHADVPARADPVAYEHVRPVAVLGQDAPRVVGDHHGEHACCENCV